MEAGPATSDGRDLLRAAFALVVATGVIYLAETVAGVLLGAVAGSPVLTGLGVDSAMKLTAAVVLAWELGGRRDPRQEAAALRLLAVAFFAVAAYLATVSVQRLATGDAADVAAAYLVASGVGALLLPPLIVAKRVLARRLNSPTLVSEADKARLYALLCVAVLAGLGLELAFGWWWADPVAALAVAALAVREGVQDWSEARAIAPVGVDQR